MEINQKSGGFFGRRPWLVWTIGLIAAVLILAAFMSRGDVVPVQAAVIQRNTIRSVISTNGKVEPLLNFQAHAPVGTTVRRLLVNEGDHVKKGQLLLQLDDAEAQSQAARALSQVRAAEAGISAVQAGGNREEVLSLQSQLAKALTDRDTAQRNLDALQRLQQQGAAASGEVKNAQDQLSRISADVSLLQQKEKGRYSAPEIAQTQAQKTEAQAAYAAAEDTLHQLDVRAPSDAVVYALPIHQGDYVNPGDLLLQAADLSKVLVRGFVDEPDLGRLSPNELIEVTWDAVPGRIWKSAVSNIPTSVKQRLTRNVGEITFAVDNQDFKLLPNINVGITIVTAEHRDVISVPREAVHLDDSVPYVYQIVNNQLVRKNIQTSLSNLTQMEVTGGIDDNAVIALTSVNAKPLREGIEVKRVQ